ncbi:thermonuclease family protein [Henriciella litoralis]|uniref:thermonuclease family protein n=1 Tax=Henriciella litoralis TaxID=568102 RepID=UPI000A05DD0D|nr:thermonuclease family protein [Henriciella litoralis]
MRGTFIAIAIALVLATACAPASPLSKMETGETGRVVRVIDGDALVLDTGQSVRLVGIEAPVLNSRYDDPQPYAESAQRALEDMVMGRQVKLYYPGLTRDRYDRALAHIKTDDANGPELWVNLELARRGAARVRLYPDTDGAGAELLEAEAAARADGRGLWALNAYRPKQANAITGDERGFVLARGRIGAKAEIRENSREDRVPVCARSIEGARLVLDVMVTASAVCDLPGGMPVEMRGWVSSGRMEITHPLHVTELPAGD